MRKISDVTLRISQYVKDRGINLSKMARKTNIPYMSLYNSLLNKSRERDLKDYELLRICSFLEVNPMDFLNKSDEGG